MGSSQFTASFAVRVGGRVVARKVTALMLLSVVGVLEFELSSVEKELLECDVLSVELVAVMLAEPEVETTVTSVVDGLEFELSPLAAVE